VVFKLYFERAGLPMGIYPMPNYDDYRENATKSQRLALVERLAERGLHPADQLDYLIRRCVIPVPHETRTFPRRHSREVRRSTQHREPAIGNSDLLRELQAAVGAYLRAEYDLAQPIPARLADLLRQLGAETTSPKGI
jgi:hypothetical protein